MMNINVLITICFLMVGSVLNLTAAPSIEKGKAKVVLMKTNRAIGVAHITVKKTRKFTGKLGQAVKHARFAKKQYEAGNFDKSVYHSLQARKLVVEVMKENGAKTGSDFIFSAEENTFLSSSPSEADLVKELNNDDPAELKDEDLMNGNLNIEVL